jgi:predicted nuclease of restriction endonuclease-like (RecB) superfamily
LKSKDKDGVMQLVSEGHVIRTPSDLMKNPYILDFLGIPESDCLHETKFEEAIISNLQSFLLELGKGFAFIGRQKRLQFDEDYYYVDLVFYNCILKCYLLIAMLCGAPHKSLNVALPVMWRNQYASSYLSPLSHFYAT